MTPFRSRVVKAAVGALALAATLYGWPLTLDAPLIDPDEGLHAVIAQEMVECGDWTTPRFLGEPFRDKPVLYFWTQAASLAAFGMRETAVRLPGLVFGLLGALTTAWLAAVLAGPPVGLLAGVLYATMLMPLGVAQAGVHDLALVPWVNLALLALWQASARPDPGPRLAAALAAGIALGLAMLTKGLVGVALAGVPFAIWLVAERRVTTGRVAAGTLALALGAALAWPWYRAMESADPGYLRYFFLERHVLGFATATQIHGTRAWWYYLPVLAAGALPWALYLPLATKRGLARRWSPGARLVWIWLLADLALLSVARSKLAIYLLPVLPAVAILAATVWNGWLAQDAPEPPPAARAAVCGHVLLLAALVPLAMVLGVIRFDVGPSAPAGVGAALVLAAAMPGAWLWVTGSRRSAFSCLIASMALAFVTVMAAIFPGVARDLSAREMGRALAARRELPPAVWVVDERIGSVVFYLEPSQRLGLAPGRFASVGYGLVLTRLATAPGDVLVAVAERDAGHLVRGAAGAVVPFERAGRFRLYAVGDLRRHLLGRD